MERSGEEDGVVYFKVLSLNLKGETEKITKNFNHHDQFPS